jgi:predicted HAD superfamily hydrolase
VVTVVSAASEATRYEQIMADYSERPGDLAARFAHASRAARTAVEATSEHETAIRDVAAGVAAPALVAFVIWIQEQSRQRGLRRLRFLSRDGQVSYELTRRLAPVLGTGLDLEYVYNSRLTWSLAGTQPDRMAAAPWLLNSFIKSNAADVCARLGLPFAP